MEILLPEREDTLLHMGDVIRFKLSSLDRFQDDFSSIIMYINGVPISDIPVLDVDTVSNFIMFKITNSAKFREFTPGIRQGNILPFKFSLGIQNGWHVHVGEPNLYFEFYKRGLLYICFAGVLFVGACLIVLGKRTTLLRTAGLGSPYSLTKTQFAYWTFIIFASLLYISIVTHEMTINDQAIMLMGIAVATTGVSAMVDNVSGGGSKPAGSATSKSFLRDILSDGVGVNINRFQNVIFTLTVGILFLYQSVAYLEMPNLSDQVLLLLGVSSGAYATLKAVERPGTQPPVPPPAENPVNPESETAS